MSFSGTTNYGSALRRLLIDELGGLALHVLAPTVEAFPGTATTAAITCFHVGETEMPMRVRSVPTLALLNGLTKGAEVARDRFQAEHRWSIIVRPTISHVDGEIELGELFKVHRGQVTGANSIWIADEHAAELPDSIKIPSVTKAKDLIQAGDSLRCAKALRRVVDLPADLAMLVAWLNKNVSTDSGRTYSGGLTKFEPKEIERLRIPRLGTLRA